MTRLPFALIALALSVLLACGDDDTPADAATDVVVDDAVPDMVQEFICINGRLFFQSSTLYVQTGATREVTVGFRDNTCSDVALTVEVTGSAATAPTADIEFTKRLSTTRQLPVTGVSVGTATIKVSYLGNEGTEQEHREEAELAVVVTDGTRPDCTGSASGMVSPGSSLAVDAGTLTGASVALAEAASRDNEFKVDPFAADIGCAEDLNLAGFDPIGPAVEFSPIAAKFPRTLTFTIPIDKSLMPANTGNRHILMAYTGLGFEEPRLVLVSSPDHSKPGFISFRAQRFGRYQAVVNPTAGIPRARRYTYQGLLGLSMGSGGAALAAAQRPEEFDFVAALGGPVDWRTLVSQIRDYHFGGFCTEAERVLDPEGCAAGALTSRTPPNDDPKFIRQDFEHFNYDDESQGNGGRFDRESYMDIFEDLAKMYGNPNTTRDKDEQQPNITPPGVLDSERMRSNSDRCASPASIPPFTGEPGTGFFDDEYNPEGTYSVIAFCDGAELSIDGKRDIGIWDPAGNHTRPFTTALAVDINNNQKRDPGEPIVRSFYETYQDCGLDGVCNEDEEGYDPITNPDPAGDNYDFQYNPQGTENNLIRDGDPCGEGEPYEDLGLDGVAGTMQLVDGGFDSGEGDGCWTRARGFERMMNLDPRTRLEEALTDEEMADLDVMSDAGIRDLFNFMRTQDQFAGAIHKRTQQVQMFDSYPSLGYMGGNNGNLEIDAINWLDAGKHTHIRYGDIDAPEGSLVQGDGGHAGTSNQIINRLVGSIAWMSARWPDGDRTRVVDRLCAADCENLNQFVFDFTASTGRTGPAAVVLPPGYFDEENANERYPVVYFLHGYGQQPQDLVNIGIIIWNFMGSQSIPFDSRIQKSIFVFPDGRCRGEECGRGTFYADAPEGTPEGAQMLTFLFDLMEHMKENYRIKEPEVKMVVD